MAPLHRVWLPAVGAYADTQGEQPSRLRKPLRGVRYGLQVGKKPSLSLCQLMGDVAVIVVDEERVCCAGRALLPFGVEVYRA